MIVQSRSWFHSLTALRGTSLSQIWGRLTLTFVVSVLVTVLHERYGLLRGTLTVIPFTLTGLALGIFLGFRNNTSYDRFWEGRKLWGRMVNTTRSFTRQVFELVGPLPGQSGDPEALRALQHELVHRTVAYVHAFRHHLRGEDPAMTVSQWLDEDEVRGLEAQSNRPIAILHRTGQLLRDAWRRGLIHDMHLPVLEASLTEMTDIQGGCERIKSTPIPRSYTILIHRIVAVYAFFLPFGIVDSVEDFTPAVVLIITYAFFGLDAIGDEIEDPFGTDNNDLPLTTLSRMIEVNLCQSLGETELPPLIEPDADGLLP